jgi:hypothetical protein
LSWCHPDDGTSRAGETLFTNSVDVAGRTALHYAAALGRSDICMTVLSSFGSMLTIVDNQGRTPCEWAAEHQYKDLAAQLEARAVLYVDPYGMEEELLVNVREPDVFSRNSLVEPFSWYTTLTDVRKERERRVDRMFQGMCLILAEKGEARVRPELHMTAATEEERNPNIPIVLHELGCNQSESRTLRVEENGTPVPSSEVGANMVDLISETHAEILLASLSWDVERALALFYQNPLEMCFKEAGLSLPSRKGGSAGALTCLICCDEFDTHSDKWHSLSSCEHTFCALCLGEYLADSAKSRLSGLSILCPHHDCHTPLSPKEIQDLTPTNGAYQALINTANENFVKSAGDLKFCPHPGCPGVVKFAASAFARKYVQDAGLDTDLLQIAGAVCTAPGDHEKDTPLTYEGIGDPTYYLSNSRVPPKTAHRFCFQCGELGTHWPVPCKTLASWHDVVKSNGVDVDGSSEEYADVAQKLWMKTNTRPCPKVNIYRGR